MMVYLLQVHIFIYFIFKVLFCNSFKEVSVGSHYLFLLYFFVFFLINNRLGIILFMRRDMVGL